MADKERLEVAVQRMLDLWLPDDPGRLRLLEICFLYCPEILSSCIPHRLPLCSFLKCYKLGLLPPPFFFYRRSVFEDSCVLVFSFFINLSFRSFQSPCNASWVRDTPSMNVLFKYNSHMATVEPIPPGIVWSVQNTMGFVQGTSVTTLTSDAELIS